MHEITIDMSSPISSPSPTQSLLPHYNSKPSSDLTDTSKAFAELGNESTEDSYTSPICHTDPVLSPCPSAMANTEYLEDVLVHLRKLELENGKTCDLTQNAKRITPSLRARMVDWMVEVLYKSECTPHTLFRAVEIMDRFLANSGQKYGAGDVHIIGVVAMLLSSKFEEVTGIDTQFVYEQVVHGKIPVKELIFFEANMFESIGFVVSLPTEFEFLEIYTQALSKEDLLPLSKRLATLNLHSSNLCSLKPSIRAAASLLVILWQTEAYSPAIVQHLCEISGYPLESINEVAEKIRIHEAGFKELYPKLKNAGIYC